LRAHTFVVLVLSIVPLLACPGPRDHAVQPNSSDGGLPGSDSRLPTDARGTDQGGGMPDGPQVDMTLDPPAGVDMGGPAADMGPAGCGAAGKTCAGTSLQTCGTDGMLTSAPCANGCNAVRLECNTCQPNERVCSGNQLVVCNGEGTGTTMMACTSGCNTTLNECNGCMPNSKWCSGTTLRECTAGGTPMDLQTCANGCNATRLECNACNPSSASTCSGNSIRTCRADGSGTTDQACASPSCSGQTRTVPTCRSGRCDQDTESCNGYGCSGTSCRTTCPGGTVRSGGTCVSCGDNSELCCNNSACNAGTCTNNHCCPAGQQWNNGASRCEAVCSDIMCSNGRCPRQTGACLAISFRPNVSQTAPTDCGEPDLCTPPATSRCVGDAIRAQFVQVSGNTIDVVDGICSFNRADELVSNACAGNSGGSMLAWAVVFDAMGKMADLKLSVARPCP
jgi:hypothetical protein